MKVERRRDRGCLAGKVADNRAAARWLFPAAVVLMAGIISLQGLSGQSSGESGTSRQGMTISLPQPEHDGPLSLEEGLLRRVSVRSFAPQQVSAAQVGQLLWAAGGRLPDAVSGVSRTAPSAGGLYPLEYYLVAGGVRGIEPGVFTYLPREHALKRQRSGDLRGDLAAAAVSQRWISTAPAAVVIAGDPAKVRGRYGSRGVERYLVLDAGAAMENLLLQAAADRLGAVPVGAFSDSRLSSLLRLNGTVPLVIIPIGVPAARQP